MIELTGYTFIEQLHSGQSLIFRSIENESNKPVIIKLPNITNSNKNSEDSITYEFKQYQKIYKNEVSLHKFDGIEAIIRKDFDGLPLTQLIIENTLTLKNKIDLLITLSKNLEQIHSNKILHNNLNPSNIIYNLTTGNLKIIDFKLASSFTDAVPFNIIRESCNLQYISPEQTGRTNYKISKLSDIYSLGIVFYEMLSGTPPFPYSEPLEIIHSHIAKLPKFIPDIPEVLSKIALKLIEKDPHNRYQNLSNLISDLSKCKDDLSKSNQIKTFPIAQNDFPSKLHLPSKIYGNSELTRQLNSLIENINEGNKVIALISGEKGYGKSTLIRDLYKPVSNHGGILISGKFDKTRIPGSGNPFFDALDTIIFSILKENKTEREAWAEKIKNTLGDQCSLIVEVIPKLKQLLDIDTKDAINDLQLSENRFYYAIRKLISVFSTKQRPLVIALDNFHFADNSSRKILETILDDNTIKYLTIICTINAEENKDVTNLSHDLKKISGYSDKTFNLLELKLSTLSQSDISSLLNEIFSQKIPFVEDFSKTLLIKTKGHPYFLKQQLLKLYESKDISYNKNEDTWEWSRDKVNNLNITDNVVKQLNENISNLSKETQEILRFASVIGNTFYYSNILELRPGYNVIDALNELLEMNYIESTDDLFRYLKESEKGLEADPKFRFSHSTIWETAYTSSNSEDFHYEIGMLLKKKLNYPIVEHELLFNIVTHLNKVIKKVNTDIERRELLQMNMIASEYAKNSFAYESAKGYISSALLLCSNDWDNDYEVTLSLYNKATEISFLLGDYKAFENFSDIISKRSKTALDRLPLCRLKIKTHVAKNSPLDAIEEGKNYLSELGFQIPKKINTLQLLSRVLISSLTLSKKSIATLRSVKEMDDPTNLAIIETLFNMGNPCYLADAELSLYISIILVQYSIKYGNSPFAINAYSYYGLILSGILHDYKNGLKYDQYTEELASHYKNYEYFNRTLFHSANFILPLHKPLLEVCNTADDAYNQAVKDGDFEYAPWSSFLKAEYSFYAGVNINLVKTLLKETIERSKGFKQETQILYSQMFLDIIQVLKTGTQNIEIKKIRLSELKKRNDSIGIYLHHFANSLEYLMVEEYDKAFSEINKAKPYRRFNIAAMAMPLYLFYSSLIRIMLFKKSRNKKLLKPIKRHLWFLKRLSKQNSNNFKNKYLIIKAALLCATNKQEWGLELFEQAIEHSEKNGFIHEAALACELAGDCYIKHNRIFLGKTFIDKAYRSYHNWGSIYKQTLLQKRFPNYVIYDLKNDTLHKNRKDLPPFDAASLRKAAKLISNEINLQSFIKNMMKVVLEESGASKGVLLLKEEKDFYIEAIVDINAVSIMQHKEMYNSKDVPQSVMNSLTLLKEPLIFDKTHIENDSYKDEYFSENIVKSLLALPLKHKNNIVGIIYLENSLSETVFQQKNRLEILTMLTSDIVISLENARLYNNLEKTNQQLEVAVREAKESARTSKLLAKKAQVADNAKGQFLSNLSHEFRTPLNAIVGMSALLKDTDLNVIQKEYLETLQTSTNNLCDILNGILDFSEISSGSLKLNPSSFSLNTLLDEIYSKTSQFIGNKDITILTITGDKLPEFIIGDYNRIKQAMLNLVDNAVKFTKSGTIQIKTEIHSELSNSELMIVFQVKDTGIGISEANLENLYQAFTQEDGSTTRSYGGLGLGLAITKEISNLMSGSIGACKNPEKGSSIWFTFKVKKSEKSTNLIPSIQKTSTDKLKILIVEDNPINQKMTSVLLNRYGFEHGLAENGAEAIDILSKEHFDLVLMDCQMPIMDGYTATGVIRDETSNVLNHTIPIIALTGNAMPGDKEKCLSVGMDDYLAKPFSIKELKSIIDKWS